ncbi:BolA/IbaG family iron-sulfur metabolism protein [Psychrobacter sp. TAE2020]|uniref:BolA family protein n=1 Tax=Psychrobacter sp. TAE2020 TaxID=2846762 RepID=UPI001C113A30|nr:BolA/IbaG family iron-sulfur metabolism protein [Psychrobacter sp. TAE2020]MBU5617434.1 BolA/IbaG family iron-sulfur metabolism protein [Psychrobacter sp. TAE2020]
MNADDLIAFLQQHYPDAFIEAANQGTKFDVRVVDASFDGKRSVQRQQAVYALVNDKIASGDIHALNIQALTPSEWEVQQQN